MNKKEGKQADGAITKTTINCKYCKLPIVKDASKCHECGGYQNWWRYLAYIPFIISIIMVIVAITQVMLSFSQHSEAKKERIEASTALEDANDARRIANDAVDKATKVIDKLERITEFYTTLAAAQSDDRKAYNKLKNWAEHESYEYSELAYDAYKKIEFTYVAALRVPYVVYPDPNDDFPKKSYSDLCEGYNIVNKWYHAYFVKHIWGRNDFPKKKRLEFLINVLRDDESLTATHFAGKNVSKEANLEWNPFHTQPLIDWWEENRSNYNNSNENQPTDSK